MDDVTKVPLLLKLMWMVSMMMMMMMTLIIMKGLIFLKLEMICLCLNPIQRVTVSQIPVKWLADQLAEWAVTFRVTHTSLSALLSILRVFHTDLPKDPGTLLRTGKNYTVQAVAGGSYYHFGIASGILQKLGASPNCTLEEKITFQVNIDGLPLFKSSNSQFWPILGMLDNPPIKEPFIIGLFYGSKKPTSASDFLSCFAAEMKELQMNGLTYNGTLHRVSMSVAICDAPARAFVKNIKYHSGYFGCDKCIQEGEYDGKDISSQKHMLHYELMHSSMKWQMRDTTEAHHHSES